MLVLFETSAGYSLFKLLDEGKLANVDDLNKAFLSAENAQKIVTLQKFKKFKNTSDALKAATALLDSKLSKGLKRFLRKEIVEKNIRDSLAVADAKLGGLIKEKLGIQCLHDFSVNELLRGIRSQMESLITDMAGSDMNVISLGLAHSLSRYKLKFSPDKVDTMIVQAIALLDDLDKELNTYAMRVREWYGWHFPELGKIVTDNILYARTVKKMGVRTNAKKTDFSEFLPEEIEKELKEAAKISMGTDVSEEDISNISELCDQVVSIHSYREQLFEYLKNRMHAIAPNLTLLVGELVGARLIAHAGSLMNLAKYPASTVQILGAEKALFRALKTKHDTPKYGLLYHASLVGQASPKNKGKIARFLSTKATLAVRVDAMAENETVSEEVGIDGRTKVENRLKQLESGQTTRISGTGKQAKKLEKYDNKNNPKGPPTAYNPRSDVTSAIEIQRFGSNTLEPKQSTISKKKNKQSREGDEEEKEEEIHEMKSKKRKSQENNEEEKTDSIEPNESFDSMTVQEDTETIPPKKKKKKKKNLSPSLEQ